MLVPLHIQTFHKMVMETARKEGKLKKPAADRRTLGPFRAYFRAVTPSAGARALVTSFGDGDETGIHQTVMRTIDHDGTEHYYDLNGHRLSGKPQQGIYIHQGKKHVAK